MAKRRSPAPPPQVKHVIRTHNPWRRWVIVCVATVFLLVGGWGLYTYGRSVAEYDWSKTSSLEAEERRLVSEIRRLRSENERLAQRVVLLERNGEIDKTAAGVLNQSLRDEQAKLTALKEQVEFYRGIVSPEGYSAAVRVYELEMRPVAEAGLYEYDLVLIQPVRHDTAVSGSAELTVHGLQDGQPKSYRLSDVEAEGGKSLLFSFKYFQQLSGSVRLPKGFKPTRVQVDVVRADTPAARIQQTYNWKDIEKTGGA